MATTYDGQAHARGGVSLCESTEDVSLADGVAVRVVIRDDADSAGVAAVLRRAADHFERQAKAVKPV